MNVGQQVRAKCLRPYQPNDASPSLLSSKASAATTRRAVIATVNEIEACILWESLVPRPIAEPFRIAPNIDDTDKDDETIHAGDEEATVPIAELLELFDFEKWPLSQLLQSASTVGEWKNFGDQLFRAGDYVTAVAYYEHALHMTQSNTLQVGCTVMIRLSTGHVVGAELDCFDDDSADLTLMGTGEEKVVKLQEILLVVMETEESLQERILLNLGRSLMQLAGLSLSPSTLADQRRSLYLKGAVLATTLALTILTIKSDDGATIGTATNDSATRLEQLRQHQISALLVRSRAQEELHKYPQAMADIQSLFRLDASHKQGRASWNRLQQQKLESAKLNKRLAKTMSQWVQTAMNQADSNSRLNDDDENTGTRPVSAKERDSLDGSSSHVVALLKWIFTTHHVILWASVAATIWISWWIQKR